MALEIYLNFAGNCKEAVSFYQTVFGCDPPEFMCFGDIPEDPAYPLSEEEKTMVMHTELTIAGSHIMFSDVPSGMPFVLGNNINITYQSNNKDEMNQVFNALQQGGKVFMPLEKTFWSEYYGFVEDKFGVGWQINFDDGEQATR